MPSDETSPPSKAQSKAQEPAACKRLDSWKEIAAHLNRDIRTVQFWEKREGLPIHRHTHTARSSVFAFAHELDAWRNARHAQPAPPATSLPPTPPASDLPATSSFLKRAVAPAAVILAGATVLLGSAIYKERTSANIKASLRNKTLAVLPFEDHSPEPREPYLAAGLTDALITDIGRNGLIHVISPEPNPRDRANPLTSSQIAHDLHADLIVKGTVLRLGPEMRVTVRLIDAPTDRDLWAETYKRSSGDVLSMQDEIASSITSAVAGKLTGSAVQSNTPMQASITHPNY